MSGRHEAGGWDAESFDRWLTTQPDDWSCIHEGEPCPGPKRCVCGCDACWYEDPYWYEDES